MCQPSAQALLCPGRPPENTPRTAPMCDHQQRYSSIRNMHVYIIALTKILQRPFLRAADQKMVSYLLLQISILSLYLKTGSWWGLQHYM